MEPETHSIQPFRSSVLIASGVVGGIAIWLSSFPSVYYMLWVVFVLALWAVPLFVAGLHVGLLSIWHRTRGRRSRVELRGGAVLVTWLILVTAAVVTKLPLHVHFSLARSTLEEIRIDASPYTSLAAGFRIGSVTEGRCDSRRRLLHIRNDDSYFVYSPHGIEGLCYGSGSSGALGGSRYWMVDD